jgi:predicted transglutaminase-like cysteine proteinase
MLFRIILASIALNLTAPITAEPPVAIPVDLVARAKFPGEKPEFVDALADFNRLVNASIIYTPDDVHYGVTDHWVGRPQDGKGDCEDYALTKLELLGEAGFPVISNTRIRSVYVKDKDGEDGHAILEVRMPNGAVAELDNRFDEPMTRRELEARGYLFFEW